MKKVIALLLVSVFFISCNKEEEIINNGIPQLLYTGNFAPTSGIEVSGQAKITVENNFYKVVLSDFSISSGPDLKVYLSKSNSPNEFISLGNLTEARIYDIPQNINLNEYTHVLIHCEQYNHLYAIAELNKN